MNLLSEAMTECQYINRAVVSDGEGGVMTEWSEGAKFDAAIVLDDSTQAKIAAAQGVTALYTITTSRAINLQFHEVIKRLEDGKIFRVTSDGDDKKTPRSAGLDMRQVSAEEWRLPSND